MKCSWCQWKDSSHFKTKTRNPSLSLSLSLSLSQYQCILCIYYFSDFVFLSWILLAHNWIVKCKKRLCEVKFVSEYMRCSWIISYYKIAFAEVRVINVNVGSNTRLLQKARSEYIYVYIILLHSFHLQRYRFRVLSRSRKLKTIEITARPTYVHWNKI